MKRLLAVVGVALVAGCGTADQACVDAVHAADEIQQANVEVLVTYRDVVNAIPGAVEDAMNRRTAGIENLTGKLNTATDIAKAANIVISNANYEELRDMCLTSRL